MFKDNKQIIKMGAFALLVLAIIAICMVYFSNAKKVEKVDIPIAENSNIESDGEYVFFNSPEGNVMIMNVFETKPQVWVENYELLSVSDKNVIVRNSEESIVVFNREEKGIDEIYNVKTDTAHCTDGAVYYKDEETKRIMQIDRSTKEETVFLDVEVNDFIIVGNKLLVAQGGDSKGILMFDYDSGSAALHVPETKVKALTYSMDNMIVYTTAKNKVRRLNLNNGNDIKVKKVKTESLCFSRGVYFYVEKKLFGGYRLGINDSDAFR